MSSLCTQTSNIPPNQAINRSFPESIITSLVVDQRASELPRRRPSSAPNRETLITYLPASQRAISPFPPLPGHFQSSRGHCAIIVGVSICKLVECMAGCNKQPDTKYFCQGRDGRTRHPAETLNPASSN
jgi:hypothetical protein